MGVDPLARTGDGWAVQSAGVRLWGIEGAAGLMLRAPGPDGLPVVLMQYRSEWTSMPLTWGIPGGARDLDESVEQAALREAAEETGIDASQVTVVSSDVTARFEVDYGIRRASAGLWPELPSYTGLGGIEVVSFYDPSVTEWTYTTVHAWCAKPLDLTMNSESIQLEWVPEKDLEGLPLMDPFRESLARTRCQIVHAQVDAPYMCAGQGPNPLWVVPS